MPFISCSVDACVDNHSSITVKLDTNQECEICSRICTYITSTWATYIVDFCSLDVVRVEYTGGIMNSELHCILENTFQNVMPELRV